VTVRSNGDRDGGDPDEANVTGREADPGAAGEGAGAQTQTQTQTRARPDGGAPRAEPATTPAPGDYDHRTTVIARSTVRLVVPIILLTSISLLLQGHNLPGGGFIGGVLTATAFVLVYVVFGADFLAEVVAGGKQDDDETPPLVGGYRWLFSMGLALAVFSGLVPLWGDFPFLTQGFVILDHVPLYGEFEVASALAFDVGVYFVVVGALLTILGEVGDE
jgi:multicomponent Na+:H+ antiporter subunit B